MKTPNHNLDDLALIRLPEVLEYLPIGKSTWWKGVKSGKYPKGIKLGARTTAWKKADIHQLLKNIGDS